MSHLPTIEGKVIQGEGKGQKIGFPTINIPYNENNLEDATYEVEVVIDQKTYHGLFMIKT